MFGMLDYRAHKLFWLLTRPLWIIGKALYFIAIGAGILIAQWTEYPLLGKIVVGYVAFEAIGFVLHLVWLAVVWFIQKIFFWIVDVVPAKGADEEEAHAVVVHGPVIWLGKKFGNEIENWTPADTRAFVRALNWRAKLFFEARRKVETRVRRFQRLYDETGRQPATLTEAERLQIIGDLEAGCVEKAVVHPQFFNSIVGFALIAFAILMLSRP